MRVENAVDNHEHTPRRQIYTALLSWVCVDDMSRVKKALRADMISKTEGRSDRLKPTTKPAPPFQPPGETPDSRYGQSGPDKRERIPVVGKVTSAL